MQQNMDRSKFFEEVERDEYEHLFYNFTIEQFKNESRFFFNQKLKNQIRLKVDKVIQLLKTETNSVTEEDTLRIVAASQKVTEKILAKIASKEQCLDNAIEKYFRIPSHINIIQDETSSTENIDLDSLRTEVQDLENLMRQVF